jgi:hypothetical protein
LELGKLLSVCLKIGKTEINRVVMAENAVEIITEKSRKKREAYYCMRGEIASFY